MSDVILLDKLSEQEVNEKIYVAAGQCYNNRFIPGTDKFPQNYLGILKKVIASGHDSILEHVSFSFLITGLSRVASHQLVRHRIASYSQQSQRYVTMSPESIFVPDEIVKLGTDNVKIYKDMCSEAFENYNILKSWKLEDEVARYILPNAVTSNIVVTMNIRALANFFSERLCGRAQKEIRDIAHVMSNILCEKYPFLFVDCKLGKAKCIQNGFCKEHKPCKPKERK